MVRNQKKTGSNAANTIIGHGVKLEAAKITGCESIHIDGEFIGDINIDGTLVIGETGSVTGDINVKYIVIAGWVKGNVRCSTAVHIASSSHIEGNIEAQSLVVDDGAQLNGQCKTNHIKTTGKQHTEPTKEAKR